MTAVFDAGAYRFNTPNNPLSNLFARLGYGGNLRWPAEVLFVSLARFEARSVGVSQSSELIPRQHQVAYYFQVQDPVKLIQAVQPNGSFYTVNDLSIYITPIIDQAASQILNNVSIRKVYTSPHKISEAVAATLKQGRNRHQPHHEQGDKG